MLGFGAISELPIGATPAASSSTKWNLEQSTIKINGPGSLSFVSNPTAGNLVIVAISSFAASIPSNDVTDNQGNTYTQAEPSLNNGGDDDVAVFYCENVAASGTFTISNSTGSSIAIYEFSYNGDGTDTTGSYDQSDTAIGNGTASSLSVTPTQADSLVFAAQTDDQSGVAYVARSPFTLGENEIDASVNERLATEYYYDAPASSTTAGYTAPSAGRWALVAVVFHPPSGGGGGVVTGLFLPLLGVG